MILRIINLFQFVVAALPLLLSGAGLHVIQLSSRPLAHKLPPYFLACAIGLASMEREINLLYNFKS
ncbi:hypothetical protein CUN67_17650 [Pantoea cypripedii]|uniref:Uncharacterized protein n=1 Tax=Pantoea cypripedii TaxID=55209 RepID=A0A6B9G934_PANCY|nr:hypothetical protein CUN67_17650 [Pantoea cypripedii]